MKFMCTQGNLLVGLTHVTPLAGRNVQLPILQHVLIEAREGVLHLTCTDLEVGAQVTVSGKVESEGACTVSARQLFEYVQQLPSTEPVALEIKKKQLLVTAPGFKAQFPTAPADDFPLLPSAPSEVVGRLPGRLFCQALEQTIFAAARDEVRPEIHSLYVHGEGEEVRLAATDSFRLAEAVVARRAGKNFSLLLPVAAAQEVRRLFNSVESLELMATDNFVVFRGEGLYLSSRLVDGTYPDYRQIIPSSFECQGEVQRDDFLRALKILSVFLSRDSRRIAVQVKPQRGSLDMRVEGSEAGQGEVTLEFNGSGTDVEAFFNITYLLDGVTHGKGEKMSLGFGGSASPVALRPVEEHARTVYIVMPIQV